MLFEVAGCRDLVGDLFNQCPKWIQDRMKVVETKPFKCGDHYFNQAYNAIEINTLEELKEFVEFNCGDEFKEAYISFDGNPHDSTKGKPKPYISFTELESLYNS